MALRYSFGLGEGRRHDREGRSPTCSRQGLRTADIKGDAATTVSTTQMGDAILGELRKAAG